jgi:hypothetical protein
MVYTKVFLLHVPTQFRFNFVTISSNNFDEVCILCGSVIITIRSIFNEVCIVCLSEHWSVSLGLCFLLDCDCMLNVHCLSRSGHATISASRE